MAVREYIGARYVPTFAKPFDWDSTKEYEPLTIVQYNGNSFTSRQFVPTGIDINNENYWAETGNYNAQIEAYREEVLRFDSRISDNANEITTLETEISGLDSRISANANGIATLNTELSDLDTSLNNRITTFEQEIEGKFPITTENIVDNAITNAKIADNAITNDKMADNAITNAKMADNAITNDKMADNSIGTAEIIDGSVTHAKIGESAINSININDGSIEFVDLNDNVQNRIRNNNFRYSNMVFISDSYGRGVGADNVQAGWVEKVAAILNPSTYINVSNSGAGFIATGRTSGYDGLNFSGQLDYAVNNLPDGITAYMVDYVVIGGGYNDHDSSGQPNAAKNTVDHARTLFPNAEIIFFPLCVGDRELNAEFHSSYIGLAQGTVAAGATTFLNSLYWLFPYEKETSNGDQIHPNGRGYSILAENIAGTLKGGVIPATVRTLGASAEGFSLASDANSEGFRTGVDSGVAWFGGAISRIGTGDLCTLPSYCRPRQTTYIYCFAYSSATSNGVARISINAAGLVKFFKLDFGEYNSKERYTIYIPTNCIPLGHSF